MGVDKTEDGVKNILVIGGSYFVGRVFVEELCVKDEYSLYVLNRGSRPLELEGVDEIVCDRHDAAKLARVVPSVEWHAVVDFCAYEPEEISSLIESIPGSIHHYIYISTTTVYQNSKLLPMTEDTLKLTGPLPGPHGDYGYKKWLLELELERICKEKGIAFLSLRPSFIYGKYNYAPREAYFFDLISKDETIILPSAPQALYTMVSVWDVAKVCIACLGNEEVYNNAFTVSAEELISYDRLIEVLEGITSRTFNLRRQPARMLEASGIPLPFPLEEHLVYSGALLRETLDYQYMPFAEGMRKTYNCFFKIEE